MMPVLTAPTREDETMHNQGTLDDLYQIYVDNCQDENGNDICSHDDPAGREPPKTFEEWLDG